MFVVLHFLGRKDLPTKTMFLLFWRWFFFVGVGPRRLRTGASNAVLPVGEKLGHSHMTFLRVWWLGESLFPKMFCGGGDMNTHLRPWTLCFNPHTTLIGEMLDVPYHQTSEVSRTCTSPIVQVAPPIRFWFIIPKSNPFLETIHLRESRDSHYIAIYSHLPPNIANIQSLKQSFLVPI